MRILDTRNLLVVLAALLMTGNASAQLLNRGLSSAPVPSVQFETEDEESNEELNPFDPAVEDILKAFDQAYEIQTGISPRLNEGVESFNTFYSKVPTCVRETCEVWAQVVKSTQTMYLYRRGELLYSWKVSTGTSGRGTPNMDMHPNGRIYDRYSSRAYPGGNYNGLGNMPYAVFIRDGFAIHGTPKSNWAKLGQRASHGCIRLHPDNAYYFNRLVREVGISQTWITVQD